MGRAGVLPARIFAMLLVSLGLRYTADSDFQPLYFEEVTDMEQFM